MKYFFDTEFIEGFHKPLSGKRRHFIDLISIGIVADDGREYYALCKEFNPKDADTWVKENVLKDIYWDLCQLEDHLQAHGMFSMWGTVMGDREFKYLIKKHGKSINEIAKDIIYFVNPHMQRKGDYDWELLNEEGFVADHKIISFEPDGECPYHIWRSQPEFWAYYADYDWVVFCSLFGRMINLPKGFPMYCRDLKQVYDEKQSAWEDYLVRVKDDSQIKMLKEFSSYPKQDNEHKAIDDANWNKKLYNFLQQTFG